MNIIKLSWIVVLSIMYQIHGSDQICPTPLPKEYQSLVSGDKVIGYFGNWDVYGINHYQIDRIDQIADKLTHLVYGFMKPDDVNNICKPHDLWADIGAVDDFQSKVGGNFAKMMALKKRFPHLKILLSIGGGKYNKNFVKIAQSKKQLQKFAQSCVDLLDFYDHEFHHFETKNHEVTHFQYQGLFDGIDLDWEWNVSDLTEELSQAYTYFISELHKLLKNRQKKSGQTSLLTVALQVTPKIYKTLELKKVVKFIDWFHVMAYDFFGPNNATIGFNAPVCGKWSVYSVDGSLHRIMQEGVAPDKMVLGLPLYGYVYENTDGYDAVIHKKNKVKTISYHMIQSKYLKDPSFVQTWSDYESVPSLYSKKDRTFVSYDSQESLLEKVDLAKNKKMLGVVVWRLSGDDAQHSLVSAISQAVQSV